MGRFDKMAWDIIHNRKPPRWPERKGLAHSGRACNFAELEQELRNGGDFQIEFPQFLDEFYLHRTADFFAVEPSDYFDIRTRAFFAGVTEYLCHRFNLPVPVWVERPDYFLSEYWKKCRDTGEPEFARRNIGYDPRNLIRL